MAGAARSSHVACSCEALVHAASETRSSTKRQHMEFNGIFLDDNQCCVNNSTRACSSVCGPAGMGEESIKVAVRVRPFNER